MFSHQNKIIVKSQIIYSHSPFISIPGFSHSKLNKNLSCYCSGQCRTNSISMSDPFFTGIFSLTSCSFAVTVFSMPACNTQNSRFLFFFLHLSWTMSNHFSLPPLKQNSRLNISFWWIVSTPLQIHLVLFPSASTTWSEKLSLPSNSTKKGCHLRVN